MNDCKVQTYATTISSTNILTNTMYIPKGYYASLGEVTIGTSYKKQEYKCAYCETVYEHRTGKCENCGAPLGEAIEI